MGLVHLTSQSGWRPGHELDLVDVREMLAHGLVEPTSVRARFDEIATELHRFPAVDPADFVAG